MHYIEKSLPLRRLDSFDRRHVCHLSRSRLLIYNDGSQPAFSHLSLTTSKKSRAYHDPDYEPRIQAALDGVNEKKYTSLAAAAREDVSVLCTFLSFICQQIIIQVS